MKRIDIEYGGRHYSVGGRDLDDLLAEIVQGMDAGAAWLRVNDGEAHRRDAMILISPGVEIAVSAVPPADEETPEFGA